MPATPRATPSPSLTSTMKFAPSASNSGRSRYNDGSVAPGQTGAVYLTQCIGCLCLCGAYSHVEQLGLQDLRAGSPTYSGGSSGYLARDAKRGSTSASTDVPPWLVSRALNHLPKA